ncbi:MAG TPA: ferritin-like fold-containing protein [Ornithinicoccus sp.]|nr:ferritin-like fold-containing protein [Ornithinicoccus sp.]
MDAELPEIALDGPAVTSPGDDAVAELLGAIGYAELTGALRMAADAITAPSLGVRVWMGRASSAELDHFERIVTRIRETGRDPEALMTPFIAPVDAFHERTKPRDWLEALVKVYVGDGIARDFYREIAQHVDQESQELIEAVLEVDAQDAFVVRAVTEAIELDPTVSGRLALWARRLVGEAIAQTQYVAVEREALMGLMVGGQGSGIDLADLGRMFTRLIELHSERMTRLGLTP